MLVSSRLWTVINNRKFRRGDTVSVHSNTMYISLSFSRYGKEPVGSVPYFFILHYRTIFFFHNDCCHLYRTKDNWFKVVHTDLVRRLLDVLSEESVSHHIFEFYILNFSISYNKRKNGKWCLIAHFFISSIEWGKLRKYNSQI